MATRTTMSKTMPQPKPAKAVKPEPAKKAAGIPAAFIEAAKERSKENLGVLKSCGAFTSEELEELKTRMTAGYKRLSKTSGPVIHMTQEALAAFLKDGTYRTFGEVGTTGGTPDEQARLDYTKRTYGYEDLKSCEKYGTISVAEANPGTPAAYKKEIAAEVYGSFQVKLKPEVGNRTTINLLDSGHQWGVDDLWKTNGFGWLFPVPYRTEDFDDFVGCLLAVPTPRELKIIKSDDSRAFYFKDSVRIRNNRLLELVEGMSGNDYVEAHIHGEVTVSDVESVSGLGLPEEVAELARAKGVKVAEDEA